MSTHAPGTSRLRLVISEAGAQPPLASLLALQRSEEPDVELSLSETILDQQVEGLLTGLYDVGLATYGEENSGLTAEPIWQEPLALALPARSPLLTYTHVPLPEALRYPMVLWHPTACAGLHRQVGRVLHDVTEVPIVAERVTSSDLMMTMVAAGYGIGLAPAAQIVAYRPLGVVMRPLAGLSPQLITYLLRPKAEANDSLSRFARRPQRSRNRTHFCSRERTRRVRRLFHQRGSKGEMVRCGMNPLWSVAEQRIHPARGRTGDDVPHQRGGLAWRARQAL